MDRVAVVTGSGSGIGAGICLELARRHYQVVVTDVDEAAAERTASRLHAAACHVLDVTDPDQAEAVARSVAERFGTVHVWVNNAGISAMTPFLEVGRTQFDRTIAVNLAGVYFGAQAAARVMIDSGVPGRIINLASMAGKQGRVPYLSDYVASKFGVVGATQAMAYELAPHDITVNCVCPGYVATPMQERELGWEAALRGTSPEQVRDMWVADTPLGRLEEPDDVAQAVAFLASDEAAFITGEALAVNGGAYMD
jgi:meso-butanediol dehydrogenase/(S,S)-butanediol dehydrogenase/diacetyl reductase